MTYVWHMHLFAQNLFIYRLLSRQGPMIELSLDAEIRVTEAMLEWNIN